MFETFLGFSAEAIGKCYWILQGQAVLLLMGIVMLNRKNARMVILTVARKPCFATFAGVRRGGGVRPPGGSKRSILELRGKNSRLLSPVLAIGGIIFDPRSIFDPEQVKGQIFGNSMTF